MEKYPEDERLILCHATHKVDQTNLLEVALVFCINLLVFG
jgi:hypothetical protein